MQKSLKTQCLIHEFDIEDELPSELQNVKLRYAPVKDSQGTWRPLPSEERLTHGSKTKNDPTPNSIDILMTADDPDLAKEAFLMISYDVQNLLVAALSNRDVDDKTAKIASTAWLKQFSY